MIVELYTGRYSQDIHDLDKSAYSGWRLVTYVRKIGPDGLRYDIVITAPRSLSLHAQY